MNKWIQLNRSRIRIEEAKELSARLSDTQRTFVGDKFICPSCDSKVTMQELIERKGSFGCVNCVR